MWNQLSNKNNQLDLYPISPWIPLTLKILGTLPILWFILFLVENVHPLHLPWLSTSGLHWALTIIGIIVSQLLWGIVSILDAIGVSFHWDLRKRTLNIRVPKRKNKQGKWVLDYDKIPQSIHFDTMETLILNHIPLPGNKKGLMLELHWRYKGNLVFIPITAFHDPEKARRIARTLQHAMSIPLDEIQSNDYSFKGYKQDFLTQFGESDSAVEKPKKL